MCKHRQDDSHRETDGQTDAALKQRKRNQRNEIKWKKKSIFVVLSIYKNNNNKAKERKTWKWKPKMTGMFFSKP